MANSNFNAQGANSPAPGGYAQPSPGVTEQVVTDADPSGNAYATELASGGTAILETGNYRDSVITVQASGVQAAPTAATVIVTITPGTAGLWEITGNVTITGTTVAATDSNNVGLYQTAAAKLNFIPVAVTGTTGSTQSWPIQPTVLNLSGADTVNVKAIANATASSSYTANLTARRVG